MTTLKTTNRMKRGEVSMAFTAAYRGLSDDALIQLLHHQNPQKRTAAAVLLGERKCAPAIQPLCDALKDESALYSRIADCDALAEIGLPALTHLIPLLGCIGHNQHTTLPNKGFYKKSYPLPRDIVARTIAKMGTPVLGALEATLAEYDLVRTLEAVDALGHISYNHQTTRSLSALMNLYHKYPDHSLLRWKIVRAFSAFPNQDVTDLLESVLRESQQPALRWEAVRSLGLQKRKLDSALILSAHADPHEEVCRMVLKFLHE